MHSRARSALSAVVAATTVALGVATGPGAQAADRSGGPVDPVRATAPGVYVVTLAQPPAAVRLPPRRGHRFDSTRPAVTAYAHRLRKHQDWVLAEVGDPAVLYHYTTALDGFAASLTSEQVRALRRTPGVALVERSTKQHVDLAGSPRLSAARAYAGKGAEDPVGLTAADDVWAHYGGPARAGRGVVVGVVDTGIWPENPSFTGLPQRTPGTAPRLPGFHGDCRPAAQWSPDDCTDKVVSARWFVNGFGAENVASAEYLSPRDGTGHGSHVASTVAGDHGVRAQIDGEPFGTTSGMAPAARLAVYKACWTAPEPAGDGCTTADTAAAVDQAVADGVDVLNYSISGSRRTDDTMARAFLGAASAGVFVAASAGNTAGSGTVQHAEPWVTTVAASSDHAFRGAVRLGNGRVLTGAMVADAAVRRTRLVTGDQVAATGASPAEARHCEEGSLDAARADGTVVVCLRGDGARVDKSAAVAAAGGAGMVLLNTRRQSVDADVHAVPTVHLDVRAARTVRHYVAAARGHATAALVPRGRTTQAVPGVAGFSARGPVTGDDVLKPDLTAPGVSVLGAVAPPSDSGRLFDLVSGTSTAAAHVAGFAALVKGVHRDWSPARVKSVMMTTAYDLQDRPGPLTEGAGHVAPSAFPDPGIVFDTRPAAWRRELAGTVRARDVNAPSISIRKLVGHATVERRITNVTGRPESYSVRKRGLPDVDVQAFPATVLLAPGQTRTVRLRITARPTASVDRDVSGWLVWSGDRHDARIPVTVHPTVVAAPATVDAHADRGRVVVRGRSGNGRTVKLHTTGLVPARTAPVRLAVGGDFGTRAPSGDADTPPEQVQVPAGTDVARFEVSADAGDDVDLYVYRDDHLVASDDAHGRTATVTLPDPEPGSYAVYARADTATEGTSSGRLSTWLVPRDGGIQVELSTDAVGTRAGKPFRYSASWHRLDPAKRWLGVVRYGDTDRRTLVEVH